MISPKTASSRITIFAVLMLVILFCWCSCSRTAKNAETVSTDFVCKFDADYKSTNVKGTLTRYTAGTLKLDIDEPSTLKNLSMEWDGEKVTLKLYGLSFNVEPDTIPQSALGRVVASVLDSIQIPGASRTESGNEVVTKGDSPLGSYEAVTDPETGYIRSLSVPSQELTVSFSDITVN